MKAIASGLLLIICFVLQSTLFAQFNIGGIVPNLILILTASIGFRVGRKNGLIVGFVAGLLSDIFFGNVLGLYAFIYMYLGFINGSFKKVLLQGDYKLPMLLIALSDIIYGHAMYILKFFIRGDFHYWYYIRSIMLPELIYTTVMALALFPLINLIFNLIEKWEKLLEGEEEFE